MAAPTVFASRLPTILGRRGATHLVAGTRAVRGASASVRALSTVAASHEAPFCLASPPPADPEALRSRWREEALSLLATPACPDDDRSRWREQCLAIAGGAEAPAPPRDSHELGGYFS